MVNPENFELVAQESIDTPVSNETADIHLKKQRKEKKNFSKPDPVILEIEKLPSSQEQLTKSIELMESSLAQTGTPNFKIFWEARKKCLELFKDASLATAKIACWPKYHELTKEALRLKALLEEQTAFAVEQIETAISALEIEVQDVPSVLLRMANLDFPNDCSSIQNNLQEYLNIQKELSLLNTYSTRITGMRKELVKTDMRIRQKNLFFQKLSAIGDKVFPRRKDLTKSVSQLFIDDVDAFVKRNFTGERAAGALHHCRQEIKTLQIIAKMLNLNTHAFNYTRTKLSESWDKLKLLEQEQKVFRQQKKESQQKNVDQVLEKIQALQELTSKEDLPLAEAQKQVQLILQFMKSVELGRDEVKMLREKIDLAQKPVLDKLKLEEQKRQDQAKEKAQKREEKVTDLKSQMKAIQSSIDNCTSSELKQQLDSFNQETEALKLSDEERIEFQEKLEDFKETIISKEEDEILNLPRDEDSLTRLEQIHEQRLQRRSEIEQNREKYRKISGGSGLDITQAMYYNKRLNIEKQRLEQINQQIEDIENIISELSE